MLQKLLILFKYGYPSFWSKKNNLIEKIIIFILFPFSFFYFLVSKIDKKLKKINKVGIPVICIGNINTGGSGKTPFVIYLANLLKKKKINTHIVSRGYLGKLRGPIKVDLKKHSSNDVGDEALLLAKQTDTWVSKNKFEGALKATLESGFAHYWSRSRKKLWMKGETSGNTQKVIEIKVDCDFDSILVIVNQKGPACHNETYTCFTTKLM